MRTRMRMNKDTPWQKFSDFDTRVECITWCEMSAADAHHCAGSWECAQSDRLTERFPTNGIRVYLNVIERHSTRLMLRSLR